MKSARVRFVTLSIFSLIGTSAALASTVGGGGGGSNSAEYWNHFVAFPTSFSTASEYVVVIQGDQTTNINTQYTEPLTDAFADPNPITVNYDSINNDTLVTYSGSSLPPVGDGALSSAGTAHFGLNNGGASSPQLNIINSYWVDSADSSVTEDEPVISITYSSSGGIAVDPFAIFYVDYTNGSASAGDWFELSYTGSLPQFQFTNPTGSNITLSDVGYFTSPTEIPLDQLNITGEPPPGSPGSNFTPLPSLDGKVLGAGSSVDVTVPLPASIWGGLALLAGLGSAAQLCRQRRVYA